jgi:hypothetical protein
LELVVALLWRDEGEDAERLAEYVGSRRTQREEREERRGASRGISFVKGLLFSFFAYVREPPSMYLSIC